MSTNANSKAWRWACSMALACVLFFCAVSFNVQAAEECDVAVIGATVKDDRVYTTLYCQDENKPDTLDTISFYVDGKRVLQETGLSLKWVGDKAQVTSGGTVTTNSGNLTVIIEVSGDSTPANNNRTVMLKETMAAPPSLTEGGGEEQPDHQHSYSSKVTAPGCTTAGYTTYTCGSCGYSYTGDSVAATGHSYTTTTVAPTTSAQGYDLHTCSKCGNSYKDNYTDKLPESGEEVDVKPVTNLKEFSATSDFVTLTWEAPTSGTAPTAYAVYMNGVEVGRTTNGTTLSYTVTGLVAHTNYSFSVVSVAGDAQSEAATLSVTTHAVDDANGKPDLIVTDISWDPANPAAGDQILLSATIKNVGTKTSNAEKHGVVFYLNNNETSFPWCDTYKSALRPGQAVTVTVNGAYNCDMYWTLSAAGSYPVTAMVDDGNLHSESNENNNKYTENVTVKAQSSVELPDDGGESNAHFHVASAGCYGDKSYGGITVTVDGKESPCMSVSVNRATIWNQRRFQNVPVTIFEKGENETVTVRVALSNKTISSVVVRPLSKNVEAQIKTTDAGQTYVEFEISKCGNYSVEFNNSADNALQLFVNPDYTCNTSNLSGTYIPLGTVRGPIGFGGTIYGSGVIWSTGLASCPVTTAYSGARIHGITLVNQNDVAVGATGVWCVEVPPGTNNVEFNYFHIFSRGANGDGISIQSSWNIHVKNSYLRTWDDGVVLKNYSGANTNNVTVTDTVFWTDLAQSMEIGAETNKAGSASAIHDATFQNIDIIHAFHKPSMSIHNMDNAEIYNVTWKNVTIEDAQMGHNDGYGDGWPLIIDITNVKGGEVPGTTQSWTNQHGRGSIHNVTFENIKVISWENDTTNGRKPGIRILNSEYGGQIYDIKIKNLTYGENGTPVTKNQLISGSEIYCQFVHMDSVPGTAPGGGTSKGHDNTGYGCNGNCTAENFAYNGSTNGSANLTVTSN